MAIADLVKTTLGPKGMVRPSSPGTRTLACWNHRSPAPRPPHSPTACRGRSRLATYVVSGCRRAPRVGRREARTARHRTRVSRLGSTPLAAQDKILQSMSSASNIMVTNDGATILKSLYIDNPAAKVLVGELPQRAHQTSCMPDRAPWRFLPCAITVCGGGCPASCPKRC
mmetsp:Transcript_6024/g.20612  ORF Transcript_6024/g.20612 Transcript_6024/m.20612 type:complete len:170 (+) Transcript_6024:395-904(+)